MSNETTGWIGVDLDGTLAQYDGKWRGVDHIGDPIPAMQTRVLRWLTAGKRVKIFTARVHGHGVIDIKTGKPIDALSPIKAWCREHLGQELEITNVKDFGMIELWDDRAVQVVINTGKRADGKP